MKTLEFPSCFCHLLLIELWFLTSLIMNSLDWFLRLSKLNVIQRSLDTDYPIRSLSAIKTERKNPSIFSTVCCGPCSQRLWHSQKSRSRCFSGTLSCFFDLTDIGNLISGSSAFSKSSLNIWKFMVHILLKPGLENFEHYFTSVWDECNCAVVWAFFGIAFLWDWNENWTFAVL